MTYRFWTWLAIASFAVTLSTACSNNQGDCDKAVGHIIKLMQKDLSTQPEALAKLDRDHLLKQCISDGLSKSQERCILAAEKLPQLNGCDQR